MKVHSTNYFDTFIEVAEDTKATAGTTPPAKEQKTIAQMQYEFVAKNPYKYTSDDVLFRVFAEKNDLSETEFDEARKEFFSTGRACLRASPLTKTYGFGIHCDSNGKIAAYGMETEEYQNFLTENGLKKVTAMRSKK